MNRIGMNAIQQCIRFGDSEGLSEELKQEGAIDHVNMKHLIFVAENDDSERRNALLRTFREALGQDRINKLVSKGLELFIENVRYTEKEKLLQGIERLLDFFKYDNLITMKHIEGAIKKGNLPFLKLFLNYRNDEKYKELISQEQLKVLWEEALYTSDLNILAALITSLGSKIKELISQEQQDIVWQKVLAAQDHSVQKTLINFLGHDTISKERWNTAWRKALARSNAHNFDLPIHLITSLGSKIRELISQEQQDAIFRWIIKGGKKGSVLKLLVSCLGADVVTNPAYVALAVAEAKGYHHLFDHFLDFLKKTQGSFENAVSTILTPENMEVLVEQIKQSELSLFYYLKKKAPQALAAAITEQHLEAAKDGESSVLVTLLEACTKEREESFFKGLCSENSDEKDEEMENGFRSKLLEALVEEGLVDKVESLLSIFGERVKITPELLACAEKHGDEKTLAILLTTLVERQKGSVVTTFLENLGNSIGNDTRERLLRIPGLLSVVLVTLLEACTKEREESFFKGLCSENPDEKDEEMENGFRSKLLEALVKEGLVDKVKSLLSIFGERVKITPELLACAEEYGDEKILALLLTTLVERQKGLVVMTFLENLGNSTLGNGTRERLLRIAPELHFFTNDIDQSSSKSSSNGSTVVSCLNHGLWPDSKTTPSIVANDGSNIDDQLTSNPTNGAVR